MRLTIIATTTLALATPAVAQSDAYSPAAARAVVQHYYAAIDRGDFRTAYGQWSDGGRASGKSYAAFRQGFAATARSRVTAGAPTDPEGAAGSIYVDVPVDVRAVLKNGRRRHFTGRYTLRRVNPGMGGTAQQQRWHIAAATLRAVR